MILSTHVRRCHLTTVTLRGKFWRRNYHKLLLAVVYSFLARRLDVPVTFRVEFSILQLHLCGGGEKNSSHCYVYRSGSWRQSPSLPIGLRGHACVATNGQALLCGGFLSSTVCDKRNARTITQTGRYKPSLFYVRRLSMDRIERVDDWTCAIRNVVVRW